MKSAMNFPVDEELKILINEEQNLKLTSDNKEVYEYGVNYETVYQAFQHISPELKTAEYEVERARYDYKIAKGRLLPSLSLREGISMCLPRSLTTTRANTSHLPFPYLFIIETDGTA